MTESPMALDPRAFRNTIGLFATGVTVITAEVNGEVHGMTANAVASLSLDPMLLLVSVGKKAHMAGLLQIAATFTLNILRADQESLSTFFAGGWKQPEPPPFQLVRWGDHPHMEATRLDNALAAIACAKHEILEGGDHWIVASGHPGVDAIAFFPQAHPLGELADLPGIGHRHGHSGIQEDLDQGLFIRTRGFTDDDGLFVRSQLLHQLPNRFAGVLARTWQLSGRVAQIEPIRRYIHTNHARKFRGHR